MGLNVQGVDELTYWPPVLYDEFGAFVPGRFAFRLHIRLENNGSQSERIEAARLELGWLKRSKLKSMVGEDASLKIYPGDPEKRWIPPSGAGDLTLVFDREFTAVWCANLSDQMKWRSEQKWHASRLEVQKLLKSLAKGKLTLFLDGNGGARLKVRVSKHLTREGTLTRQPEVSPHPEAS